MMPNEIRTFVRCYVENMRTHDAVLSARDHAENGILESPSTGTHRCLSGTMRFWFDANKEDMVELNPVDIVGILPNLPHEALMVGDAEEIDTWAPPRQDWPDGIDDYLRKG